MVALLYLPDELLAAPLILEGYATAALANKIEVDVFIELFSKSLVTITLHYLVSVRHLE